MDWTITRQELVLFHARHKRMRIICGHDTMPDSEYLDKDKKKPFFQYRQNSQNILDALRKVLDDFPTGSEINFEEESVQQSRELDELKIWVQFSLEQQKEALLAYLVYWRMCLNYEGWDEKSNPDKIILEFITGIGSTNNLKVNIKTKYDEQDLAALLSTLPLSPQWDLWGVCSGDSRKESPTLLDKIKSCIRPVYAAQLKYNSPELPATKSSELLGYSSHLRACYTDAARDGVTTTFVSERDYYEYCYHPTEGSEKNLYLAYALFYDALIYALSGKQKSDAEEDGNRIHERKKVFYIAYQIKTSLDRHHFWHIWLQPDDLDNATLEQLWASWWPLHQQILDWPTLHASLAAELEQLDIAYAQGEIFNDIINPETEQKGANFSAEEFVCEHAYMLFPMSRVCYDGKVWAYQKYIINKGEFFKKAVDELVCLDDIANNTELVELLNATNDLNLEFGFKWEGRGRGEELNGAKKVCPEAPQNTIKKIIYTNQHEAEKDYLQRQRYRRLVEQQMNSAKQMFDKNKSEKLMREAALQSAVAQIFARNFAHNIGSHVAIRATNRMVKERIAELYGFKNTDNTIDKSKFNEEIVNWLDYMSGKLDQFEVDRNEFLAGYKLPARNAMLYRDVILPFCENTLLMDNIAHSEGIHYKEEGKSNKLKIKVRIDGSEIKATYPHLKGYNTDDEIIYPDKFPYLLESREIETEDNKVKYSIDEAFATKRVGSSDIEICLTNEHTIYSILENLIRNSAKHNKSILEDKDLIITVDIKDKGDDDYYTIQIYDKVSNVSSEQLNSFAASIDKSLITDDGDVQKESLGIADIKINLIS